MAQFMVDWFRNKCIVSRKFRKWLVAFYLFLIWHGNFFFFCLGDRINATIYAVLSQVRSYEQEKTATPSAKQQITKLLSYNEGCYDSYYTLQVMRILIFILEIIYFGIELVFYETSDI